MWAFPDMTTAAPIGEVPPRPMPMNQKSATNNSASSGEDNGDGDEILHCTFPGCLKEFSSRWSLTRHTRTHTGERPFKCDTCGKEFVQKCSLKRHEQTHSQEKQWICDHPQCGKKFKLKEYLDVHKRTHAKFENEFAEVEDTEDPVVQDTADAAGALIDQLRQRLVRMSVRHHEQLFVHQEKERQISKSLRYSMSLLAESVALLEKLNGPNSVPPHIREALQAHNASGGAVSGAPVGGGGVSVASAQPLGVIPNGGVAGNGSGVAGLSFGMNQMGGMPLSAHGPESLTLPPPASSTLTPPGSSPTLLPSGFSPVSPQSQPSQQQQQQHPQLSRPQTQPSSPPGYPSPLYPPHSLSSLLPPGMDPATALALYSSHHQPHPSLPPHPSQSHSIPYPIHPASYSLPPPPSSSSSSPSSMMTGYPQYASLPPPHTDSSSLSNSHSPLLLQQRQQHVANNNIGSPSSSPPPPMYAPR